MSANTDVLMLPLSHSTPLNARWLAGMADPAAERGVPANTDVVMLYSTLILSGDACLARLAPAGARCIRTH